jgi:hypothetical protein
MIPQCVAEILDNHVKLRVEGIDRMYLNVYIPKLQREPGAAFFFRGRRQQIVASSALMAPMSRSFVAALDRFAVQTKSPVVPFQKGQRKDDVMKEHLRKLRSSSAARGSAPLKALRPIGFAACGFMGLSKKLPTASPTASPRLASAPLCSSPAPTTASCTQALPPPFRIVTQPMARLNAPSIKSKPALRHGSSGKNSLRKT